MKFKFIYLAFFTCLLFLFANERDNNKRTTESYHNNDYKVHFVVHKTKKAKNENFLKRKMKRIQKKVKRLVEKYDEIKKDENTAGKVIGILLLIILLWLLVGFVAGTAFLFGFLPFLFGQQPGSIPTTSVDKGLGIFLFFLIGSLLYMGISSSISSRKKKKQQKG